MTTVYVDDIESALRTPPRRPGTRTPKVIPLED
jgi:hypothetical protein